MTWNGIERRKCPVDKECKFEDKIIETANNTLLLHKAIYGNGDPSHGMLWMVEENTKFISQLRKHSLKLFCLILIGVGSAVFNLFIEIIKSHVTLH